MKYEIKAEQLDRLIEKQKEYIEYLKSMYPLTFKKDEFESKISSLKQQLLIEDDSEMLFHECPNCNNRCNCSDQPCSCCERESKELPLDLDNAWCTKNVLLKLIWASEYLLHEKDYDGHNYEEIEHCVRRGKEIITDLEQEPTAIEQVREATAFILTGKECY